MKTLRTQLRTAASASSAPITAALAALAMASAVSCGGSEELALSTQGANGTPESSASTPGSGGLTVEKKSVDADTPLFGDGAGAPIPAVTGAPAGTPIFGSQEGWVEEEPSSGMRFKQFRLPGDKPELDALLVVAKWPGGIGPIESNLDRWVSQVGSETPARDLAPEQRWTTEPEGYLITHIHVEGSIKPVDGMAPDIAANAQGAILAGFVEPDGSSGVWTVKMTGPASTVRAHKERYMTFMSAL